MSPKSSVPKRQCDISELTLDELKRELERRGITYRVSGGRVLMISLASFRDAKKKETSSGPRDMTWGEK